MQKSIREISTSSIVEGMMLAEDILDNEDNILLSEGIILREKYIEKIKDLNIITIKIVDSNHLIEKKKKFESVVKMDKVFIATKEYAKKVVKSTVKSILEDSSVDFEKIEMIVSQMIEDIFMSEDITLNLAKIKILDDYLFDHSVNVCVFSLIIGIFMRSDKDELKELGIGAMLHDVGKAFVPQDILSKPSKLTDKEFEEIKKHSKLGHMSFSKKVSYGAGEAILSHHENIDGTGYPNGKKSKEIHVFAKIVSIADVFDALTSDRVYSKKIDKYSAVQIMLNDVGKKFDISIVNIFLKAISCYPIGLNVILNTGEYGIIVKRNMDRPLVRVLLDKNKQKIQGYFEIDLSKNPSVNIVNIDPNKSIIKNN
ncbi:HD-GYP domain-containing protein [Helicovermis profundi]|uniref:HD-GYP domain-containing protein n=1 Tax=Helicovermis profundi TaxID=3065157 RepID=A0AAU9EG57_9FIRM|nr:HD-GYP domain-containing protein [Clostridia bacterium S502]